MLVKISEELIKNELNRKHTAKYISVYFGLS